MRLVLTARALGLAPTMDPVSSRRVLVTLEYGGMSSTDGLTFNPNFTDWMMGWLIGWTDPRRPVMGWSRWLQLSHTALSRLV